MINLDGISQINAIKRNQVLACIEVAKKYQKITKLIIFGSAVTDKCDESSDLDICIEISGSSRCREMYELSRDLYWACDHNCDILKYNKLNDNFKREVDQKGVVVYELS